MYRFLHFVDKEVLGDNYAKSAKMSTKRVNYYKKYICQRKVSITIRNIFVNERYQLL